MTPDKPLLVEELRRRLAQPGPWTDRLRRLIEDIAAIDDEPALPDNTGWTCDDVDAALDAIVDGELADRAEDDLQRYTTVHLKTCARCRQACGLLIDTLVAERANELATIPVPAHPNLSFLQSPAADQPWITRLRTALTGEAFGLTVALNTAYLQQLFFAPRSLLVRADEALPIGPAAQLILSDAVTVGDQIVAIELAAQRDQPHADDVVVQAVITSFAPLPQLWATLTWAGEPHRAPVNAHGVADFGRVSLQALQAASRQFEIVVEAHVDSDD